MSMNGDWGDLSAIKTDLKIMRENADFSAISPLNTRRVPFVIHLDYGLTPHDSWARHNATNL